jgi:hypothetical protein
MPRARQDDFRIALQKARLASRRGVQSYYTQGVGSYYAAGAPPLPGRWATRGLGYPVNTSQLGIPVYRRDYFGSDENPFTGIGPGSYSFGDVNEFGVVTVNGVWVGDIVDGRLVQSAAQKATADKLRAANTAAAATSIAAGSPPAPNAQVAASSIGSISEWFEKSTTIMGTTVKNSYLAAAGGLIALVVLGRKKGRF